MFVPDNIKHKVNLEMALKLNLNEKNLEMMIILYSQELKCILHLNRFIKCQK